MKKQRNLLFIIVVLLLPAELFSQHHDSAMHSLAKPAIIAEVAPQPLLAQAVRLKDALSFLGSPLSSADSKRLEVLQDKPLTPEIMKSVQEILDPYCLAIVDINPEARVKVSRGPAIIKLMQGGWSNFLVKVHNEAGVTAQLQVQSVNALEPFYKSTSAPEVRKENVLTEGQVGKRFLELQMYRNRPLQSNLSGLGLEYSVLQIYSKDAGQREAEIGFNIGQGSQDTGFRNAIDILFNIRPSVKMRMHIKDDDGSLVMASFTITDAVQDSAGQHGYWNAQKGLMGYYPLPSRRVASYDEYPDFFFQPQVYRKDGEHVELAPGRYNISFTRGPEYIPQVKQIMVPPGSNTVDVSFQLKRWINLEKLGWYSADHHVHAAGCSHYESPEEGVRPADMWRQVLGEDLNVAGVLTWGPGWYHQKTNFTGQVNPLSTPANIMRYDVEVSGFPSSHSGHLVLLRLREDDYPGTTRIEEWPSWTLPILKWAKAQGAVVGYAHSGWGLEPIEPTKDLPNYTMPKMDGIGANEYIVTVTQNLVDFYSAGDTPAPWELNMWYHTLNCGFRTRLSGETDYPCIFDERMGIGRSYFKPDGALSFDSYVAAIKKGRCYVSDGKSHIIDFSVNQAEAGTNDSKLSIHGPQTVKIKASIAAYLPERQTEAGAAIARRPLNEQPYWDIERARIGTTRKVRVELIVNGKPADTLEIVADGKWKEVNFSYALDHSAWLALRVYPSAHSNPVFAEIDGKPIRVKSSAEWCRKAVDQCWKMKQANIRPEERPAAEAAYNRAENDYDKMIQEASDD